MSDHSAGAVSEPSSPVIFDPATDQLYRELEHRIHALRPNEDLSGLQRAYVYAADQHKRQKRKSGEPYIIHPLAVATFLADRNLDLVTLQTALLHDVLEDTGATLEELRELFGEDVAHCVDGVTKLTKLHLHNAEERQAESVRKMLLAMVSDLRVILVKLADRIHNLRTLQSLAPDRQRRIAEETLEIYAPIAHRLGMGKVRAELEDLAFSYLEPEEFNEIVKGIESRRQASQQFLNQILDQVQTELRNENIPARVEGRIKRPYSVYLKLKRQKITLEQVYDLMGLRIITDSVKNCYAALGIIHKQWPPVPGRIKDFIAIPRPNLYQSLHTSVIGPGGQPIEVQIRTEEMHRLAEEGIAAHWKYKEGHKGASGDDRIAWLRSMVEWQQDVRDSSEFLSNLKVDLYPEEVYTFTPRRKVLVLPRGATPIDFAYAIHTDVGHTCVGCKVNGRIVPLRYALRNGDVVEILTQPGHMPSKDWLNVVKTARARNKIKHVVNLSERAKAIDIGQKLIEKEARRLGVPLARIARADLEAAGAEHGYSKLEDLYSGVGYGKVSARNIIQRFLPEPAAPEPVRPSPILPSAPPPGTRHGGDGDLAIKVRGIDDVLVYRARCCNPIRGEGIVGYITRGKGIAVHSTNCPNVQNLMYEADRKIEVEWERSVLESFPVRMIIYTDDRPGMLNQLTSLLFGENSNIRSLEARGDNRRGDGAVVEMTVEVRDKKQLERLTSGIRRIPGVRDVERL
jgi:GTP diphosphokinase / guanosine-3',5'-bis(diphosphate) 3'-diphosphatase